MRGWLLIGAVVVGPTPAHAQDWDHDQNIELAVEAFVAVDKSGGMDAATKFVGDCYRDVDSLQEPDAQLKRLEYCAGMDFAGFLLARRTAETGGEQLAPFFQPDAMLERLKPLSRWVEDPSEQSQILRAWSRAAAEALDERKQ